MHALRVLEFEAILERLQRHCETTIGAERAQALLPSFEPDAIWRSLETTRQAYEALARYTVPPLGAARDYRQALKRASKGGVLGGQEIFGIGDALRAMRGLKTFLAARREDAPLLAPFAEALPDAPRLEQQIEDSLEPDGSVKDSASPALATLRQRKKSASARIVERVQAYTTGRTRDLLSDPIYTVRDGRYVIPVKAENRGKIRGIVHDTSGSGQTIYLEPEDVLQLGNALREIEASERQEEQRILGVLSDKVGAVAEEAIGGIETAGEVDFLLARARLGFELKGTIPQRVEGNFIEIEGGRHPMLNPETAVPLNLSVGKGRSVLITGPNTGGKTVSIKTVGLFVLMAQSGLMPPAIHLRMGHFTQVWADIGDEQSVQQSLSTFSGHIRNISEALKFLREGALVLLDEVGAGTDPAEGAALAKSILTAMSAKGATVLASTHYGELKAFAYSTEGFDNAAMEFDAKTFKPTFRLIMGAPGASHALRIAERYGIPKEVVEQAREGLGEQAQDIAVMMERLDLAHRQARIAQSEADRRAADLKRMEQRASQKLKEAEEVRATAHGKANEVIEAALREIRLEANRLFEELKGSSDPRAQEKARKGLRELQDVGRDFAQEFLPKKKQQPVPVDRLKKGSSVRIDGYQQVGILVDDPRGSAATVQVGMLKITVPVDKLQLAEKAAVGVANKPSTNLRLSKAMNASTEIQLIQQRAEEARNNLEKFIDDAVLAGLPSVRIVHGKGEGILRKVTHDVLRAHPSVSQYRDGEPAEGGAGVTIASFK
ncbi:MAG TPA: endonuclease MutS2 [Fimbriimonas sp.]